MVTVRTASRISLRLDADDIWAVWLDTETQGRDGVLIGVGATRDEAITDADRELRTKLEALPKFKEGARFKEGPFTTNNPIP